VVRRQVRERLLSAVPQRPVHLNAQGRSGTPPSPPIRKLCLEPLHCLHRCSPQLDLCCASRGQLLLGSDSGCERGRDRKDARAREQLGKAVVSKARQRTNVSEGKGAQLRGALAASVRHPWTAFHTSPTKI